MNIRISLHYGTRYGEGLFIRIGKKVRPMDYAGDGIWAVDLTARDFAATPHYTFQLRRGDGILRTEWRGHTLLKPASGHLDIRDRWIDRPADSTFWSSAFKDVIFARGQGRTRKAPAAGAPRPAVTGNVTLRVAAAAVRPGEAVAIAGSSRALGAWQKVTLLDDSAFPWWTVSLDVKEATSYKFVLVDRQTHAILRWEDGADRRIDDLPARGTHRVLADADPHFGARPWRGAGTAVPVFSLRTADSFGIGEFHDLKRLVDWAVATGQNVLQLLPINDTTMTGTWQDSYPYNANSSFALHPQFIHLPDAGVRVDKAYRTLRDALNALPAVDYERVNAEKTRLLRKAFATTKVLSTPAYKAFVAANRYWLLPYAAFCVLRDVHGTADFSKWGAYKRYNARKVAAYAAAKQPEIDFYCFEQYLLDAQLKDAVAYAHAHGVIFKGDLPIGVSRQSADAWTEPQLFHMDSSAGAPPDAFSADGQNWGFPTYDWDRMAEDGFAWWKARLRKMSEYFDAFRIDHILGFFRIWEIPLRYRSGLMGHFSPALPYSADELRGMGFDVSGGRYVTPAAPDRETDVLFVEDPRRPGWYHPRISAQFTETFRGLDGWHQERFNALYDDFFYRRHNDFWKASAYRKLPALLRSTGMLACGEDLGMIPSCVPEVMADLNILSLEIQRMPKDVHVDFADPASYPYASVCATGTHDTAPLRAWWEEDRAVTDAFYHTMLRRGGAAPFYCEPWVCEQVIRQHAESPSMLAILPLQDWLAIDGDLRYPGDPADERINIPAIPRHYWRYRMHLNIEDLLAADAFNARLRDLLATAGRGR